MVERFRALLVALILGCLLVSGPALAQTPVPPPPIPSSPLWIDQSSPSPGPFATPDLACQNQHDYHNPGATLRPATRNDNQYWSCHWDLNPNSNTVLPALVKAVCLAGTVQQGAGCIRSDYNRAQREECGCGNGTAVSGNPEVTVGNPVQLNYGAKIDRERDYSTADGRLAVDRFYYSLREDAVDVMANSAIAGFGSRWHGVIPGRIDVGGWNANLLEYLTVAGEHVTWVSVGNAPDVWTFNGTASNRRRISFLFPQTVDRPTFFMNQAPVANGPAEVRMDMSDGEYILFRRAGPASPADGVRYLVPIEHGYADGYTLWYDYPDTGEYPSTIRDSFSRQLQLTWVDADRATLTELNKLRPVKVLSAITVPDGSKINYTYGYDVEPSGSRIKDRLESVTHTTATGTVLWGRSYLYENAGVPYALTGKVDQLGRRLSTYTYDAAGLVASTERAGGVGRYTITNLESSDGSTYRYVTNPLGHQDDYTFHMSNRTFAVQAQYLKSIVGHATGSVPATTRNFSIDGWAGDYHIDGYTDEGLTQVNLVNDGLYRPTSITQAAGTSVARTQTLTWHPVLDLPTSEVMPGLTTSYTYSPEGRLLTRTLTDTTNQTVPYATNGQTRTWTYGWNGNGRLLSIHGPKGPDLNGKDDITTFVYDASGNLLTSTNALGHVTQFANYDANGRPGKMTDPNGIDTLYVYDALGRLTSVTVKSPVSASADATTRFEYDVEGRISSVTSPATQKVSIDHDLAGQVTSIYVETGDRVTFTRDAMGNITNRRDTRGDGFLMRETSWTFDALGRLLSETLGTGRTSSLAYDARGNVTSTISARSNATTQAFDGLNRLVSSVAPDTGTSTTTPDVFDRTANFTDPHGVQTTYIRNGFGEVIREVSPDRGTSTYYYDAAGDLIASIDGRGQRVEYVRDALGRILSKTPAGRPASEAIAYTYDGPAIAGSYNVGRLVSASDATGSTQFLYDHRGNITTKRRNDGATTVDLAYGYDLADRIQTITYPSGRIVTYTRDPSGRVKTVTTQANTSAAAVTLIYGMNYYAMGPMYSASLGNGLAIAQFRDTGGRPIGRRLHRPFVGVVSWHVYGYDNDDNITSITDNVDPTRSITYGYDTVGRLTQSVAASGSVRRQDMVYDTNGNRVRVEQRINPTDTTPVSTATYTLNPGTNQLASVADVGGTRSIAYDARGNTIGETRPASGITVAYDGYGRLTSYQTSGGDTLVNEYNGVDDRITGGTTTDPRHYVYDMDGRMMGEYGASYGDVKAETIWLSPEVNTPVQPNGGGDGLGGYAPLAIVTGGVLYWVHGNNLGVPIVLTDAAGNVATPTGYTPVGFPGQTRTLADLYYNRYRDYDPTTGRYIQADPIGLEGGSNPYVYANANPLKYVDPSGRNPILVAIVVGAAAGALIDLGEQYFLQHRSLDCIDWSSVGVSAIIGGAFGGAGDYFMAARAARAAARAAKAARAAEGGEAATTTVGRWMSQTELDAMKNSGRVQESFNGGVTSVTSPPNPDLYRAAPIGDVFAQFDVPTSALRTPGSGIAKIWGPNSIFGPRFGITEMPPATNIVVP